jgi:hypothetical protein
VVLPAALQVCLRQLPAIGNRFAKYFGIESVAKVGLAADRAQAWLSCKGFVVEGSFSFESCHCFLK